MCKSDHISKDFLLFSIQNNRQTCNWVPNKICPYNRSFIHDGKIISLKITALSLSAVVNSIASFNKFTI